jgi:hypothetical protein
MTDDQATDAPGSATDAPGSATGQGGSADHGDAHGLDDHAVEVLGPVDWTAWTIGTAGVVVGVIMWLCFALATLPT